MSKKQEKIFQELKDFIVNVGWTHKIHIVQSDKYLNDAKLFKNIRVLSAAVASSGLIGIIFAVDSFALKLGTAVVSFITTAMTGLDKAEDYKKLSLKEKTDANNFWELREQANSLLYDVVYCTRQMVEVEEDFKNLKSLRSLYNTELLNVSGKPVKLASKMINEKRDNDYSQDYQKFISPELLELKIKEEDNC